MDPSVAMSGMKRCREQEEYDFSGGMFGDSDLIKRRRNDTLLDGLSTFQPNPPIPSIVMDSPDIFTTDVSDNGSEFPKPRFIRANSFPFRSPSEHFHQPSPHSFGSETPPSVSGSGSPVSLLSLPTTDNPDIEMNDDGLSEEDPQSPPSPYQNWARPAKLSPKSLHTPLSANQFSGGRIPTPIHPNFVLDIAPPTPKVTSVERGQDTTYLTLKPTPNHHLPSPIIEIDADVADEVMGNQLSRLSMESMEVDESTQAGLSTPEPSPTSPMRTGRARSGAITERRRIFMGYLEDCEKCKARTPGHLAHFLPG